MPPSLAHQTPIVPNFGDRQPLQKFALLQDVVCVAAAEHDANVLLLMAWLFRATVSWRGRDTISISQRQIAKGVAGIPGLDMSRETLRRVADICEERGWIERRIVERRNDPAVPWCERVTEWRICTKEIRRQGKTAVIEIDGFGDDVVERPCDRLRIVEDAVAACADRRLSRSAKQVLLLLAAASGALGTDGVNCTRLRKALGVSSPAFRSSTQSLEALGLIRREDDGMRLSWQAVRLFAKPSECEKNWATPLKKTRPNKENPLGSNNSYKQYPQTPTAVLDHPEERHPSDRRLSSPQRVASLHAVGFEGSGKKDSESRSSKSGESTRAIVPSCITGYCKKVNTSLPRSRKGSAMPINPATDRSPVSSVAAVETAFSRAARRRSSKGYPGFEVAFRTAMSDSRGVQLGKLHGAEKAQLTRLYADLSLRCAGREVETLEAIVSRWSEIVSSGFSWMTNRPAPRKPELGFILSQVALVTETLARIERSPSDYIREDRVLDFAKKHKLTRDDALREIGRRQERQRLRRTHGEDFEERLQYGDVPSAADRIHASERIVASRVASEARPVAYSLDVEREREAQADADYAAMLASLGVAS